MNHILKSLHDLEGVNGAIVADDKGQVLGWHASAIYDAELLQEVSKHVVGAIDSVRLFQENWEGFTAQFSEGKLIIRNLTDTSKPDAPMLTLTVIADERLNTSFASVAVRVAVGKLKALLAKGIPAPIGSTGLAEGVDAMARPTLGHSQPALGGSGGASFSSSSTGGAMGRAVAASVATSGLNWSGLSGSSSGLGGSSVSVSDSASSAFLTNCTKALARKVGPLAKVFVKEAVLKVSPDRPFSMGVSARGLIEELAKHIRNPADAQQFCQQLEREL